MEVIIQKMLGFSWKIPSFEMDDKQGYPYDSGHHHALTSSLVADHFALSPGGWRPACPDALQYGDVDEALSLIQKESGRPGRHKARHKSELLGDR